MPLVYVGKTDDPKVRRYFALRRQQRKAMRVREVNRKRDKHHLLFWKKRWLAPEARNLRENDYLKVELPYALHQQLHARMRYTIPCPSEENCLRAAEAIKAAAKAGRIDPKHDTAVRRLNFLINIWRGHCAETIECLTTQRDLLANFYDHGHL